MAQHYKGEDHDPFPFNYEQNKKHMKEKLGQEPAFACVNESQVWQPGMSKRFYAACVAMQGIISMKDTSKFDYKDIIQDAYYFADELLRQENE